MTDKPRLRLGFVDYFKNLDHFFIDLFSREFEVIRDDDNPEYLIFCDETFGTRNKRFDQNPHVTKILYLGENRRPWNYSADVAISYDHYDTPNHYRLPLWVVDEWCNTILNPYMKKTYRKPEDLKEKIGFCSFISGNGGCPERNRLFHMINEYKKIDSYGPLFNNMGPLPRGDEAASFKQQILPKYKFNLCAENGSWPGYTTEKLFHALYMQTVPIYWGNPTAETDFNKKSFLSWHDTMNDKLFMDEIIKLDKDDDFYLDTYMQPMYNDYGCKYHDLNRFLYWFKTHVYKG